MNKSLLIIEKKTVPGYEHHSFGDKELELLDLFLMDNMLIFPDCILKWLEAPNHLTGGDATTLYHQNGKIIIRYEWWNEGNPEEVGHKFETTTTQLIDIINQWIALRKTDPDAILIEQNEMGTITMRIVTMNEVPAIIAAQKGK